MEDVWPSRHHCHDIEAPHTLDQTCEELSAKTQVGMKIPHQDQDQPFGWANASTFHQGHGKRTDCNTKRKHHTENFLFKFLISHARQPKVRRSATFFMRIPPFSSSLMDAITCSSAWTNKISLRMGRIVGRRESVAAKKRWVCLKIMCPQFHLQMVWHHIFIYIFSMKIASKSSIWGPSMSKESTIGIFEMVIAAKTHRRKRNT